ncbi:PaaX family transcriptional regulator C-terminal domain-containing protein [Maritimibacter sp. HL-12]|uniref:PaaX family transcriptional regulator C-terminal domain-containing protein n=1 Tax=Maritimibacter sp. HL-12 TaxID=1162418 RepID=UPI000A0F3081|nr:PaaX family transcriptional regulator C-terminal domain-containing protein [Maritimibacter sp. HL-12]SMH34112.1 transcriptional regulator, PaaX family [Maritimibacter sp. HL-12]
MSAEAAISALAQDAELRTWSLIVTIFGDLARAPGAEIPGPVLSAITARIGIKPEAMRVALHRLRKDDWLASRREGRVSHYGLTDAGRAESERATARIYAAGPPNPSRWHLLLAGPMDPAARLEREGVQAAAGYLCLAPGAWLGPGPAPADADGMFAFEGEPVHLPEWLRDEIMPPELAAAYRDFAETLAGAAKALPCGEIAALDRAALRVLVVHGWRRLVLRHPDLPDVFFPENWAGPRARAQVLRLLDRLGQPAIESIGAEIRSARLDEAPSRS